MREHGIDQTGQFVSCGGNGLGCSQSCPLSSKISSQSALGIEKRKGCHAKSSSGLVGNRFGRTAQDLAAADLSPGRQTKPRGKMLGRLPTAHIRTDLRKNLEGGVGIDTVNTGQINSRHALERLFHVGGWGVIRCILRIESFSVAPISDGHSQRSFPDETRRVQPPGAG